MPPPFSSWTRWSWVPFAFLRLNNRPIAFAVVKLVNIAVNVGLNLLFVVVLDFGIESIPLAGLLSSAVTLFMLLPVYERRLKLCFSREVLRKMLRYGLPLVPASLAAMVIQVADKPLLLFFTDTATVGIYQANIKLGIFMLLVVSMFQYAWQPFYLQRARDRDAPQLFARVLTYFCLASCLMVVGLSVLIQDIVRFEIGGWHLLHPDYWSGTVIVPIVLIGHLFFGIYVILTAGPAIEKKTGRVALIAGVGAAANLSANLILIPRFGMHGAAVAQIIAYLLMASGMYLAIRKIYPIPHRVAEDGEAGTGRHGQLWAGFDMGSWFPGKTGSLALVPANPAAHPLHKPGGAHESTRYFQKVSRHV